ncbi:MAG: relaxase/mobilization nuclease domain-containing protein [Alistipes sp.]|nr:relaxase/mobilization nuclease domain-containing protein [Alistipes senegalensis]MCM1250166.1 relaxase/mobilization nuclease domain-containing protein [Alistipes sp.]
MVAKITTGNNIYGALAYNQQKVDRGNGEVLLTHILREPTDGLFNVAQTAEELLRWMPQHYRTEKPVVHISLNPDPEDRLTDEQFAEIAEKYMERMGWGEQPYIVFKHTDIDRRHIHIVSVQVGRDGRKIKDGRRNERSVAVTEELEREYGLCPAKSRKRTEDWRLTAVDLSKGDLKRRIGAIVKPAAAMYRFQTLGEFRALLSRYNVGVEEVRGTRNGIPYRGLLYTALDESGDKAVAAPLKASVFGKAVGLEELERHMARCGERFKQGDERERLRHRVGEALSEATTEQTLRERLQAFRIDLYLRRNDTGRIVGVTFIDHENRCVANGSRLGKAYSANAFEERFGRRQTAGADTRSVRPEPENRPSEKRKTRNARNRKL